MLLESRSLFRGKTLYLWLGGLLAVVTWLSINPLLVSEVRSEPPQDSEVVAVLASGNEPASPASNHALPRTASTPPAVPRFEPTTVEHHPTLPSALLKKVTVRWDGVSFEEAMQFLQELMDLPIQLHDLQENQLTKITITDHLHEQPLYLLLDRLSRYYLNWSVKSGQVVISHGEYIGDIQEARVYDVESLLTGGSEFERSADLSEFVDTLMAISGKNWLDVVGQGGIATQQGNALIVRQDLPSLRDIEALLAALNSDERFVVVNLAPGELALWKALDQPLDIDFQDVPLTDICDHLAQQTGLDFRLDEIALWDAGIAPEELVTLQAQQITLAELIPRLAPEMEPLDYKIQDGVLWLTTALEAEECVRTSIFRVPELCETSEESDALMDTLLNTTRGPWMDTDGVGGEIRIVSPGKLVVRQTSQVIREIQTLLQNLYEVHWQATDQPLWTASKRMEVVYYRLEADMAASVLPRIRRLGPEGSWAGPENPTGGDIAMWKSETRVLTAPHSSRSNNEKTESITIITSSVAIPMAVLEIRQTPKVHQQIRELLQHLKYGTEHPGLFPHGYPGTGIF